MKHMYEIYSYDVWGNEEDGFDVNDVFKIGEFEMTDAQTSTDRRLVNQLIKHGYLNEGASAKNFEIDGEAQYTLYINYASNGRPLCELRRVD